MIDKLFDVSKKVVLITGASGLLGAEYSKIFLERGAFVVGLDIKSSLASEDLSTQYPTNYFFIVADVTSKSSLKAALKNINNKFGRISVLINNAAIDSPPSSKDEDNGPFEEYPETTWDKVMDVNLKGVFLCCQIFGGYMAKYGDGSIINVSSIYGLVSPDQKLYSYLHKQNKVFYKPAAYSASKSGILNLTRYLAVYWAKKNVRVNTLTLAGVFNNQEQGFIKAYCERIPIGRMANLDEYNGSMLFLASEASRYMTGANLIIDGGWTAI